MPSDRLVVLQGSRGFGRQKEPTSAAPLPMCKGVAHGQFFAHPGPPS